ncbi:MAG TPA: hypothetical protein VMD30_03395 [Tepidisphaeraceae bacterium]|nr:hypothetical protein [Tepidisphaeraceae bacterium]
MRTLLTCLSLLALSAAVAIADAPTRPIPANATIDQILSALKTRGDTLRDFTAHVTMIHNDMTTGDSTTDKGTIVFQKLSSGDTRIRVNFTDHIAGDREFARHHEYMLADGWLRERDYQQHLENDQQVVRPGEKLNLLKLGEGPFPLPIGQDPADVKQQFTVTKIAPAKGDPPDTIHLQLVPNPGSEFEHQYLQIDVWVDRASAMPIQITTEDKQGATTQTTDLNDLQLNGPVNASDFLMPPIEGWTITQKPYGQ